MNVILKRKFSLELFRKLHFTKRINYAKKTLATLGSGSSRIVFNLDDGRVLKIAYNAAGVLQNKNEFSIARSNFANIVAKILDSSSDGHWIISEFIKPISIAQIEQKLGISWKRFSKLIRDVKRNEQATSELMRSILFLIKDYDLTPGDIDEIAHWGLNANNDCVMLDYGLSERVYDKYYSKDNT